MSENMKSISRGRPRTQEERDRHAAILAEVESRREQIVEDSLHLKAIIDGQESNSLENVMQALRREREALGMTLDEVGENADMKANNLSALERDPGKNPTIDTVNRIAKAMGKRIAITIEDIPTKTARLDDFPTSRPDPQTVEVALQVFREMVDVAGEAIRRRFAGISKN